MNKNSKKTKVVNKSKDELKRISRSMVTEMECTFKHHLQEKLNGNPEYKNMTENELFLVSIAGQIAEIYVDIFSHFSMIQEELQSGITEALEEIRDSFQQMIDDEDVSSKRDSEHPLEAEKIALKMLKGDDLDVTQ